MNIIENAKKTIQIEAEALLKMKDYIDNSFELIVKIILESKGRLVITGIGKSAIIAQKIVATMNSTGTPAIFMHAADAIHGDLGIVQKDDIVMCISKSGNTPEIKVLVPLVKNMGNTLIGMVGNDTSFLATKSDYILNTTVETEACPLNLAPTTSTTAQLAMGDALAVCLIEERKFSNVDFARYHPGGSLGKQLYLKAGDLATMHKAPYVMNNASIKDIIVEITNKRLGSTAVLNEFKEVIGIITDGDLRRMMSDENIDISKIKATDLMNNSPKTIDSNELAINALVKMRECNISQLIVEHNSKYIGIVHLHDLLKEGII